MIVMSLGWKRALGVGVAYLRSNKYTFPPAGSERSELSVPTPDKADKI